MGVQFKQNKVKSGFVIIWGTSEKNANFISGVCWDENQHTKNLTHQHARSEFAYSRADGLTTKNVQPGSFDELINWKLVLRIFYQIQKTSQKCHFYVRKVQKF